MKTAVPVVLALTAAAGLAYVGLAPEKKPELAPLAPPAPVRTAPQDQGGIGFVDVGNRPGVRQVGPPAPFDTSRPLVVRIPPGYDPFPAGDLTLATNGAGTWHIPGARVWTISVVQFIHPTGRHATLSIRSDSPGQHPTLPGQPNAFADSRFIGADGVVSPGTFPVGNPAGFLTRFPAAGGPWLVYQP